MSFLSLSICSACCQTVRKRPKKCMAAAALSLIIIPICGVTLLRRTYASQLPFGSWAPHGCVLIYGITISTHRIWNFYINCIRHFGKQYCFFSIFSSKWTAIMSPARHFLRRILISWKTVRAAVSLMAAQWTTRFYTNCSLIFLKLHHW